MHMFLVVLETRPAANLQQKISDFHPRSIAQDAKHAM